MRSRPTMEDHAVTSSLPQFSDSERAYTVPGKQTRSITHESVDSCHLIITTKGVRYE